MSVLLLILIGFAAVVLLGSVLAGDFTSMLIILLLAGILVFVLTFFGFVDISTAGNDLSVLINTSPTPTSSSAPPAAPSPHHSGPEVFYVSDNKFTYEDAPFVCKAYGAELASYIQVEQAYNAGAEWCGYGWSDGGLALFPTQESSWIARASSPDPAKREQCGRPGVNGGYFDPTLKFGVNCYGMKPRQSSKPTRRSNENDRILGFFKDQVNKLTVDPFAKNTWSENTIIDTQTQTDTAMSTPASSSEKVGLISAVGSLVGALLNTVAGILSAL
jgi:Extracellular link domain